jgi:hypothetical protein
MKAVYSRAGPKFVYMFKTLLGHCKDLNYLIKDPHAQVLEKT